MTRRKEASLSEVVNDLVKALTPTLEDVAERSGIGYSTLRDWKRTPRTPRPASVERLRAAAQRQRDELDRILAELDGAEK